MSEDSTHQVSDSIQTRRRFLRSASGVATALAAVSFGGTASAGGLVGDDGDYEAPAEYPQVSTREHFNDHGELRGGYGATEYSTAGDWESHREGSDEELIVFVHGWSLDEVDARDAAYTCRVALEENDYEQFDVGFTWDADKGFGIGWSEGVEIARKNGPKLAQWIVDHTDDGGLPVRIIGHSLGAQVTVETLSDLQDRGREDIVRSATLLGGAIGKDEVEVDEAYGEAIEYATADFHNYYKTDDFVLSVAFSAAEWEDAVGEEGIDDRSDKPENYTGHDVTSDVKDHNSYYEPGEGCITQVQNAF